MTQAVDHIFVPSSFVDSSSKMIKRGKVWFSDKKSDIILYNLFLLIWESYEIYLFHMMISMGWSDFMIKYILILTFFFTFSTTPSFFCNDLMLFSLNCRTYKFTVFVCTVKTTNIQEELRRQPRFELTSFPSSGSNQ